MSKFNSDNSCPIYIQQVLKVHGGEMQRILQYEDIILLFVSGVSGLPVLQY